MVDRVSANFQNKQSGFSPSNASGVAYFLVEVENWEDLLFRAGGQAAEAIQARFSGLVYKHFGSDFQSLTLSGGEFFVIASYSSHKKLLDNCNQLRHALGQVLIGNNLPLEISICLTKKISLGGPYKTLIKLREVLTGCRKNASQLFVVI